MTGEISRRDDSPDDLRVSHEDRDRVAELLRVAAGDGRLTSEELDERLEKALTARTHGELVPLIRDLPAVPGAQAAEVIRIDCGSGSARRDGRWLVPERIEVRVNSGQVTLDFTEAVFSRQVLQIDADVNSGSILLLLKPGVVVDADDVAIQSGSVKGRDPWTPETPVTLRVAVSGRVKSGNITARPPRRTFSQWLKRRPKPYASALP